METYYRVHSRTVGYLITMGDCIGWCPWTIGVDCYAKKQDAAASLKRVRDTAPDARLVRVTIKRACVVLPWEIEGMLIRRTELGKLVGCVWEARLQRGAVFFGEVGDKTVCSRAENLNAAKSAVDASLVKQGYVLT